MKTQVLWGLAFAAVILGLLSSYFVAGAFLALVFGVPALVMTLFNAGKVRCPHCRSRIHREATVCPRCGRDVAVTT